MFEVGDLVTITNLDRYKDDPGLMTEMESFVDKTARITDRSSLCDTWFILEDCDGWLWDARWLMLEKSIEIDENEMMSLF